MACTSICVNSKCSILWCWTLYCTSDTGNFLNEATTKRNLPLRIIKLESMEQAQTAPSSATIFSLFHEGKFITTDISVCMDSRFDKIVGKSK
ncbi:YoaP domain-containing protein [Crassaminicella profunda]|uniref:YoaP domain-containing protein n=1 Tax=Crassaminicella profunda TaxID=1286698 RepID=UPI003CCE5A4A